MTISDEQHIANLLHRYAELIDAGDFDGVADLFANAELTYEGVDAATSGHDAVLEQYISTTRRYEDGTPKTAHVITNPIIEVHGTRAAARSRFTVLQATDALGLQPIIAGRYHDKFECRPDGWTFLARHFVIDLMGDLSAHLLIDLAEELPS